MKTEQRVDYTHLEGKIIDWECQIGNIYKAKVGIIDRDIGITLVAAEDCEWVYEGGEVEKLEKDVSELTCLNGPVSPHRTMPYYNMWFYRTIRKIKQGKFSAKDDSRIWAKLGVLIGGMAQCSFK